MNAKFRLSTLQIVSGHEITKVPICLEFFLVKGGS